MFNLSIIILCGGFGTRIKPAIGNQPKILAPIGELTFLDYLINWLKSSFDELNFEIILSLGFASEEIIKYSSMMPFDFKYSAESNQLGTLAAAGLASSYANSKDLLVINGDTIFDYNLMNGYKKYYLKNEPYLFVKEINPKQNINGPGYDKNKLTGKLEYNDRNPSFISLGALFLQKNILKEFRNLHSKIPLEIKMLDKDLIAKIKPSPIVLSRELNFIDIGTPAEYLRSQKLIPSIFPILRG